MAESIQGSSLSPEERLRQVSELWATAAIRCLGQSRDRIDKARHKTDRDDRVDHQADQA